MLIEITIPWKLFIAFSNDRICFLLLSNQHYATRPQYYKWNLEIRGNQINKICFVNSAIILNFDSKLQFAIRIECNSFRIYAKRETYQCKTTSITSIQMAYAKRMQFVYYMLCEMCSCIVQSKIFTGRAAWMLFTRLKCSTPNSLSNQIPKIVVK